MHNIRQYGNKAKPNETGKNLLRKKERINNMIVGLRLTYKDYPEDHHDEGLHGLLGEQGGVGVCRELFQPSPLAQGRILMKTRESMKHRTATTTGSGYARLIKGHFREPRGQHA